MVTKKLYLYRLIAECLTKSDSFSPKVDNGVYLAKKWPLLGLDRKVWRNSNIKEIEQYCHIKPFEVRQKKFDELVSHIEEYDIDLTKISFTNDLYEEEHEELISLIRNKNTDQLLDFISEQRYDYGNDIEEITFKYKSNPLSTGVTFSREGVLTANLDDNNIMELMSTEPIGILSGDYLPKTFN